MSTRCDVSSSGADRNTCNVTYHRTVRLARLKVLQPSHDREDSGVGTWAMKWPVSLPAEQRRRSCQGVVQSCRRSCMASCPHCCNSNRNKERGRGRFSFWAQRYVVDTASNLVAM